MSSYLILSEVLTAVAVTVRVLWDTTLYSTVEIYCLLSRNFQTIWRHTRRI